MRNIALCLLALVALNAAGCATGESFVQSGADFGQIRTVAVVDVLGGGLNEGARNLIGDYFVMELQKKGYRTVERNRVKTILGEQEFQASDFTRAEDAVRAGRILNVDAVAMINIAELGEEISMTAKLVDVEDSSILWIGSGTGTTGRTLGTLAGAALGAAGGAALGGDTTGKVVGGVAGGVLGGVAGRALTPQEYKQVRKIIAKMCQDLPPRM